MKKQPLKKLTQQQVEESISLYQKGFSLQKIGEFLGVSRQSMWDLLRRRIKIRPQERNGQDSHFYRGGEVADDHVHNMVEYAIHRGILQRREACEQCGKSGAFKNGRSMIEGHHADYNKPLEIQWLCKKCHHNWHSKFSPILRLK